MLDLHIAGAITIEEFKERNDGLNDQLKQQESQLAAIRQELEKQLSFEGEINTALVATILDKVVAKKESTKEESSLCVLSNVLFREVL